MEADPAFSSVQRRYYIPARWWCNSSQLYTNCNGLPERHRISALLIAFVQVAYHPFEGCMILMEPCKENLPLSLDRKRVEGDPAVHVPEDEAIGR